MPAVRRRERHENSRGQPGYGKRCQNGAPHQAG